MLGSTNLSAPVAAQNNTPPAVAVAPGSPTTNTAQSPNTVPTVVPITPIPVVQTASTGLLGVSVIKPLINSQSFVSLSAGAILSLFIFVLLLDMVVIERKKIVRFVGHNLDHVFFLGVMLVVVVILLKGSII
jgi:hypothetical protein